MGDEDEVIALMPGVKFIPSVYELLVCYLRPKLYGENLPCNKVEEEEIYGPNANPWHLFNDYSTSWTHTGKFEKSVYVFTRLTKIAAPSASIDNNKKTEHYVRKAGCGTWHDETGRERVMFRKGENVVIGYKRLLVYQINEVGGLGDGISLDYVGYWKMHEYSLDGFEDYVVCQITWDGSKRAKIVRSKKAEACPRTLSRSRSLRNARRNNTHVTATDDSAKVDIPLPTNDYGAEGRKNDPRLSSEKNCGFPDFGLVQDAGYIIPQGSVDSMNADWTLQASTSCSMNADWTLQASTSCSVNADWTLQASTSCPQDVFGGGFSLDSICPDVFGDGFSLDMDNFLSDEEFAGFFPFDMDQTLNALEESSAALSFSPPDNNNDEQHSMQNNSSQVLGKRKSCETEQSGKKPCI